MILSMDDIIKIQKKFAVKAQKNKKWQFVVMISFIVYVTCVAIIYTVSRDNTIYSTIIFSCLVFLMAMTILLLFWLKYYNHIAQSIKTACNNSAENLYRSDKEYEFFQRLLKPQKNKKFPFLSRIKKTYLIWGLIETNEFYRIAFVEWSKPNRLFVLNLSKQDVEKSSAYEEIINLFRQIKRRVGINNSPLYRWAYSSLLFYIKN
ncbi:alpha-N-arabinofuranosidase [Fructobacillus pseudoficulneus]|uniref:Alpha-N-arabinofuranosidase n=2 Tax=Fructobacillus pseudoficulneus TaxID=220714 RepID=A0A3F3H970_9LACO|nr:alpha-N-arabinofuranosidase [Fructobacillus pseudoficulneus]